MSHDLTHSFPIIRKDSCSPLVRAVKNSVKTNTKKYRYFLCVVPVVTTENILNLGRGGTFSNYTHAHTINNIMYHFFGFLGVF